MLLINELKLKVPTCALGVIACSEERYCDFILYYIILYRASYVQK